MERDGKFKLVLRRLRTSEFEETSRELIGFRQSNRKSLGNLCTLDLAWPEAFAWN